MDKRRDLAGETGLYTYDVFNILLNYEVTRLQRYPGPLTLLHVALSTKSLPEDIKTRAAKAMTELLNRALRVSDVPAHYNDEYLVLLPNTDEAGGRAVAERILGHFRTTQSLSTGRLAKVNAFIGLTYKPGGSSLSANHLVAEAAVAMNEARTRQSYTYVAFSDIAGDLPQPK